MASTLLVQVGRLFATGSAPSRPSHAVCFSMHHALALPGIAYFQRRWGKSHAKHVARVPCRALFCRAAMTRPCACSPSDGDDMLQNRFALKLGQLPIFAAKKTGVLAARSKPRLGTATGMRQIVAKRELTARLLFLADLCGLLNLFSTLARSRKGTQ